MNENSTKSYLMLIGSMLIFGTIGIFRRYIPLSSALLACTRGILGTLFLLIFVKIKGRTIRHGIGLKKILLLALTGALIGINWMLLFESYNYTSVPVATLCYYMEPPIVILISPIFLREKLTVKKLICVVVSFIGMIFVSGILSGEGIGQSDLIGIGLGLLAAVTYAIVIILNKKVQVEDAYEKTVIQLAAAAIVLMPYLALTEDFSAIALDGFSVAMVLIVGLFNTGVAYALYFGSMEKLKAQSIAVLSYIDPVFALILAALILKESMSVYGIIGAVLIIGAALLSEVELPKKG